MTDPSIHIALDGLSRADWLEARRQGIGSSDAAAVLGVSDFKSPFHVFADKCGLDEEGPQSEAMEWGQILEEPIAQRYARDTGRLVTKPAAMYRHRTHPWMLASPDRFIHDQTKPGTGILEIKTGGLFRREEWLEEPPLPYAVQLQHQLAVTGCAWGSFAVLLGGQVFVWTDVERHEAFIAALIEAEQAFWQRVLEREPPVPDASAACLELLRRLFPTHTPGKVVALPPEAEEWDQERLAAKAAMDAADERRRLAESHLIAALGDAECGLLASGVRYTFKTSTRKSYTVAETTTRTLRRTA